MAAYFIEYDVSAAYKLITKLYVKHLYFLQMNMQIYSLNCGENYESLSSEIYLFFTWSSGPARYLLLAQWVRKLLKNNLSISS